MSRPFRLKAQSALEHQEQTDLFRYVAVQAARDARWSLLFAVPNGTSASSIVEAVKAKKTGRKRGVPDMFLPIPTREHHGLFVELKGTMGNHRIFRMISAFGWPPWTLRATKPQSRMAGNTRRRSSRRTLKGPKHLKSPQCAGSMRRVAPADHN